MADKIYIWEKKLQDPSAPPMPFPLDFLKAITCDFSAEQELGKGGYGVVYKGVLPSGKIIAVKKLHDTHLVEDNKFQKEVRYLMGMKHQNVVQFVGYCAESSWEAMKLPGIVGYIFSEAPKRLLCFEYVCNQSLDKYISDGSSGLEWNMRCEIIRGICDGLHYLHGECQIIHLDLKPANILFGTNMEPKIADFGLSKIFADQSLTKNPAGTLGYMAPEYLIRGLVSIKADIFSLGVVIIEIITGRKELPCFQQFNENGSPQSDIASEQDFIEKILDTWRNRLQISDGHIEKLKQIRVCAELGIQCAQLNPVQRPVTQHIIDRLAEVKDRSIKTGTFAVEQVSAQIGNSSAPAAIASSTASEHDEVSELLQKLSSQNALDQREAAGVLRQLAKRSAEHRARIGESGGIPILSRLLSSTTDLSAQEHVVTTLLIISVNRENRRRIVSSGAVSGIVRALERGNMSPLALLSILSNGPEGVAAISAAAAVIPSLVGVIRNGSSASKANAVAILLRVFFFFLRDILLRVCDGEGKQQRQNLAQAHEHGLVPLLAELKESSSTHMGKSKATRLLRLMNN
ncbi:putative receptor-like protein kinase At4g00960 [Triticum dicoccoides]|uniref:putative receptor-like protein kinase At4g00960 n=1 Tax=Triticum dicoccoides TaxID=85692 RepID=UPI00188FECD2|nr:putative receptor-like protein kinase At4g00960 [Triticum dicoccoides]XP_037425016.1 putative receptor-like protein kinase At4g00960 [Triticum dicoccoides]XP_037470078.1 putative receptor-like protein kinase At4g00960 [Triticum dicoccoides]XP_037470385.1 putative receptor-like protein kinase At4g00960 [Triticum dicoccoides]